MITKMSKYSLILLSSELNKFLGDLQELGMMDITRSNVMMDEKSEEMMGRISRYKRVIQELALFKKENCNIVPADDRTDSCNLLDKASESLGRLKEISEKISLMEHEYMDSLQWGEFNPEDISKIESAGLSLHFYCISEKRYDMAWENTYPIQILGKNDGKVYFAIVTEKDGPYDFPLQESKFPDCPPSVIMERISTLQKEKSLLESNITGYAERSGELISAMDYLTGELDLYFAESASVKEGEGTISILEGFAQTSDEKKIREFLDASSVYYIVEEAKTEDNPPIKLKNNWFSKLFEPIGSLYVLPTYGELDLTPFFAPFYMLFFGLCLGDMGYGLILLILGIAVSFAMPKFSAYGKLVAWLGFGSIIMPLLSGTFFGMKLADIIPMPENISSLFFSDLKMFWFSIIFGLFQIVFARILKAIFALSNRKWDEGLTEIGWSMVIVWASFAYAGSQLDIKFLPDIVNYILAGGGLVLILFCSKPSKYFLLRPLKGIVSLYDITGVFGDMLSYIRLFGLGLTGGILALVINSIAMQFSSIPYVGWVLTVIMLIVGHLAVMGLSCLGAFVHPVRLTFVEFYKNAGFIGGGREFNPLRTYVNNK